MTAAPGYFAPNPIRNHKYIDSGAGTNNPTKVAWNEAESQIRENWKRRGRCPVVISIGTGKPSSIGQDLRIGVTDIKVELIHKVLEA